MYGALGVLLGMESWIFFFDTSGFCFVSNADISNGICVVSQFFSAVFFDDLVTRKIRGRVFDWFDRIFNRVSRDGHNFEFFPLFDF